MNKIVISLTVVLFVAVAVYFLAGKSESKTFSPLTADSNDANKAMASNDQLKDNNINEVSTKEIAESKENEGQEEDLYDEEILPATDVYENARAAYDKIMASIKNYDDIVLEQFAGLNAENCTWCPELFASLKETMLAANDEDTKSYIAELLAITGDKGNIETLIESYKNGTDSDKEIYLESLEMTAGDDNLVDFLNGQIKGAPEELKDSLVSAISNHGSLAAIESLYQQTLEKGDPNGYYDYGIGLGEVIPDAAALPKLIEIANKGDDYSHLAVKALLNYGDEGLREVVNIISNSNDSGLNNKLLADAIDHVSFDEDTESYIEELIANNSNPDVQKFAKQIKEEMASDVDAGEEEDEDYEG